MTDFEFFRQYGFEYKPEKRAIEKYYFDSCLTVTVYSLFECFEICYGIPVRHGGALFKGHLTVNVPSREAAIKHIEDFSERMKI